jgi:glutamate synthase domain-containing protein 1
MCGIVGLLVRDRSLEPLLGELVAPMVAALGARGADSTGIGIYRDNDDGYGSTLEVTKDVGAGADVCRRYGIAAKRGYLAIGHTRMATESAVTPAHSHPFVAEPDLCLVHNGSFSNYASVRRRLQAEGVAFDSDNDSEVATRFLAFRLAGGDDLEEAVRWMAKELDGFYTLAITSTDSLAVIRDAFACKPAVVAETERYVAVASEYRALAGLPDIEGARVFEPNPAEIYLWSR